MVKRPFLSLLIAIAARAIAPVRRVVQAAREQKRGLAFIAEVAKHWSDLDIMRRGDSGKGVAAKPREAEPAMLDRAICMADLMRGGIAPDDIRCTHNRVPTPQVIFLHADRITIASDIPACPHCVSAHLFSYGVRCTACRRYLFPGDDAVATTHDTAPPTYEHLRVGCCDDAIRYSGVWGKGRLIPLHEAYRGAFPRLGGDGKTRLPFGGVRSRGSA